MKEDKLFFSPTEKLMKCVLLLLIFWASYVLRTKFSKLNARKSIESYSISFLTEQQRSSRRKATEELQGKVENIINVCQAQAIIIYSTVLLLQWTSSLLMAMCTYLQHQCKQLILYITLLCFMLSHLTPIDNLLWSH